MLFHAIEHTIVDNIKLLPFLFVTYLVMEYIEHKTSEKTEETIKRAGRFGPLPGGVLGMIPQCGFSAAASNLYAGRIITLGTLFAIFLSFFIIYLFSELFICTRVFKKMHKKTSFAYSHEGVLYKKTII